MEMPAMVAEERFAWSRICTRVMLTRFAEISRATKMLIALDAMPTAAKSGEYVTMITR